MFKSRLFKLVHFIVKPYVLTLFVLAAVTFWVYFDAIFPPPLPAEQFYFQPRKKPILENKKTDNERQTKLSNLINSEVQGFDGDYAIVIKDLTSTLVYKKDSSKQFTSASIYKLAVMYKIFDLLESNKLSLDDEVAPGLTTDDALNLMITISDNNSALALAKTAGWDNIDSYLEANGIHGFKLNQETPTITADAVSDLLEKIYNNKAVSQEASQKMKELLLGQQVNDRIPKYLPTDINIAHKTGELDFVRHDAGIVFGKKSDYIFVFLTETPTPGDAMENVAQLSKKIFAQLENPQALK